MKFIGLLATISLLVIFFLSGCNTTKDDWEKAQQQNTIESYNEFLTKHPESEFSEGVTKRIAELNLESEKIIRPIDLTISLGLYGPLHSSPAYDKYLLSPRVQELIQDNRDASVYIPPTTTFSSDYDGVCTGFKDDWYEPFKLYKSGDPIEVYFRNGEVCLRKGDIFVREGTEAKIENHVYVHKSGKWKLLRN